MKPWPDLRPARGAKERAEKSWAKKSNLKKIVNLKKAWKSREYNRSPVFIFLDHA